MNEKSHTENIIVADADYVDTVAFDLTVNFERMLNRRIPLADMAQWTECVALDGGMKEGEQQQTHVILIHDREQPAMKNFTPGRYADELHGQAFRGRLGEFVFTAVQTEAMVTKEDLLADTLEAVCQQEGLRRLMVVADDHQLNALRPLLRRLDSDERRTTVFTMQPVQGGAFRHELLGFSLLAALGISSSEIEEKLNRQ